MISGQLGREFQRLEQKIAAIYLQALLAVIIKTSPVASAAGLSRRLITQGMSTKIENMRIMSEISITEVRATHIAPTGPAAVVAARYQEHSLIMMLTMVMTY